MMFTQYICMMMMMADDDDDDDDDDNDLLLLLYDQHLIKFRCLQPTTYIIYLILILFALIFFSTERMAGSQRQAS
jgi:hypothetical protein